MKDNLFISFSGGRTSAFMCKLILQHPKYKECNKLFLFANTGKEKEETLIFVDQCDKEFNLNLVWVEAKINPTKGKGTGFKKVSFETASRNGEPFKELIKKYGLPSKYYRHCTRELKEIPMHKFAKQYFNGELYKTAIGIRADEQHRISKDQNKVYLLNELNIDEQVIRNFWDRQTFDLQLKDYQGNCDACFLKSQRKLMTLASEDETIFDWWIEQEEKHSTEKQNKFQTHKNLTYKQIVDLSKKPFNKAIDKQELRKSQPNFDFGLDIEFDCFCKNT